MEFLAAYDAIPQTDAARRVARLRQHMKDDGPALLRQLRADRPVFATPVGVFVTRMPDVVEVLSTPDVFTVGVYGPVLEEALHGHPFVPSTPGSACASTCWPPGHRVKPSSRPARWCTRTWRRRCSTRRSSRTRTPSGPTGRPCTTWCWATGRTTAWASPVRAIVPEMVRRILLRPGVRPLPGSERAVDYAGMPYPQHYTVTAGTGASS